MTHVVTTPVFFISADWSKDERKRSVHTADLRNRRIWREECAGWNLQALLKRAGELTKRGAVLVGIDAVLGVPAGYWREVQRAGHWGGSSPPAGFVDWLARLDPESGFFAPVRDPASWRVDRPFFRVPSAREGGRRAFTNRFEDGLRRKIDQVTGANPIFAVSGIPGTVGSGTGSLWMELIPRLAETREFAVWPFEGDLSQLLPHRGIVLAETYPGLAYGVAVAGGLPTCRLRVAKTQSESRGHVCDLLQTTSWVRDGGVQLGDLASAQADEDVFDSLLTAAAVLRCTIEDRPLCEPRWVDRVAEGSMLLAGPVDLTQRGRTLTRNVSSRRGALARRRATLLPEHADRTMPSFIAPAQAESAAPAGRLAYRCPIPGCSKVFRHSRGGWDAHVASLRKHPDWHPRLSDPDERKRRFRDEFGHWFHG